MGADIHVLLERKVDGRWETWDRFAGIPKRALVRDVQDAGYDLHYRFTYRNYAFFAALAGVRGDGPDPRGLPYDISPVAKAYVDNWGDDGHSHTYLFADEFCEAFMAHHMTEEEIAEFTEAQLKSSLFRGWEYIMNFYICNTEDNEPASNYRFIIFFDN